MSLNAMAKAAALEPAPSGRGCVGLDGGKSRLDRIGGAKVDPVLGGEIEEGQKLAFVVDQTGDGNGMLGRVDLVEVIHLLVSRAILLTPVDVNK